MKRKFIIIIIIIAVGVFITIKLVSNKTKIEADEKVINRSEIPVAVSIYKVKYMPVSGDLSLPAVLEPFETAVISASVPGKIDALNIELGSRVTKGQEIGAIDSKVKILNLQALELSITKSKQDYERNQELFKGKAIQEVELTNSKFAYDNNIIQAEQLKQQIIDAKIISPITGIITEKKMLAGEYANVGTMIARVVNNNKLKTIVYVNEKDVYKLKTGRSTNILCDILPNTKISGQIIFISPAGDENHSYKIEILVNNNALALKSGTYVKVEFKVGGSASALLIPKRALGDGMKNPFVYLVNGTKSVYRKIVLGREVGENVEVVSGLNTNDTIILDGIINIMDGSNIEVLNH